MRTTMQLVIAAATALAVSGCTKIEVAEPLTGHLAGNDAESQMEFWHTLNGRKLTSNDEAFHALLLFLDGEATAADYDDRVEALKSRGLLAADFSRPANEAVTRGTVAVLVVRTLDIDGSVMLRLLPHSPRYATRELQYVGLYPRSSEYQTFSGPEFVAIIGRVEDYQRSRSRRAARKAPPAAQTAEPSQTDTEQPEAAESAE